MQEMQVQSLGQEDPLEKKAATHSSILAWKIPWTMEPGRLQSMGCKQVRHNLVTKRKQHLPLWPYGSRKLSINEGEIPKLALSVPRVTMQWLVTLCWCLSWQLLPVSVGTREASLHLLSLRKAISAEIIIMYFVESFLSSEKVPHFSTPTMNNMNLLLDLTSGVQMHFSETCQLEKSGTACILLIEREKSKLKIVYSI